MTLTALPPELVERFVDMFATFVNEFQEKQVHAVKDLSDEQILSLAEIFEKQALGEPQSCFGFRVRVWDDFANNLRKEVAIRRMFRRASELKCDAYCPACDGECKGDAVHDALVPDQGVLSVQARAVREMSIDALVIELLKWRALALMTGDAPADDILEVQGYDVKALLGRD